MPLIEGKSPKSFSKNVETEMHHGKPLKQSLAIAYAMKKKAKKMAHGGQAYCAEGCDMLHEHMYAKGGMTPSSPEYQGHYEGNEPDYSEDIASREEYEQEQAKKAKREEHVKRLEKLESMSGQDRKYLADGGVSDDDSFGSEEEPSPSSTPMPSPSPSAKQAAIAGFKKAFKSPVAQSDDSYAEGGDVVSSIMHKRGMAADGGVMANKTEPDVEFEANQFDDLVKEGGLEFTDTDKNSGDEHGMPHKMVSEELEDSPKDLVSFIMHKRRKNRAYA